MRRAILTERATDVGARVAVVGHTPPVLGVRAAELGRIVAQAIAPLEAETRALREEIAELRAALGTPGTRDVSPASPVSPPSPASSPLNQPPPARRRARSLIGRIAAWVEEQRP